MLYTKKFSWSERAEENDNTPQNDGDYCRGCRYPLDDEGLCETPHCKYNPSNLDCVENADTPQRN